MKISSLANTELYSVDYLSAFCARPFQLVCCGKTGALSVVFICEIRIHRADDHTIGLKLGRNRGIELLQHVGVYLLKRVNFILVFEERA